MRKIILRAGLCTACACLPIVASAAERLCDASAVNCRTPLMSLIDSERQGIDVGVWFFKDSRYVTALINAKNRGVPIRIIMDPRANNSYPENVPLLQKLTAAGIPMRKRIAGDICHWKLMIFSGQDTVEWSGANFSPYAFVPEDPYKDYEDEVIYFSPDLVNSFMTMFDNIWTNTRDYANYANVPPTLVRNYPTTTIDPRLNFPPMDSYQDRLIPLIDREPAKGWIDVDMYRITLGRPVDALIRAAARGVRIRLYLEPTEYTNPLRPGNKVQMDRLVSAAKQYPGTIEIRMRQHLGLNHQKTVWLHTQHVVVFGTSNWSDASDDNQLEANIFTDKLVGDPLNDFLFGELAEIFERKWRNASPVGAIETTAWRTPTLPPPTVPPTATCRDPKATNYGGPLPCVYPDPPPAPDAATVVLYATQGTLHGNWRRLSDATAAGGSAVWNPNAGQTKIAPALAAPANYVETSFAAARGTAYHVWVRLRAEGDSFANDSVHLQFNDSVTSSDDAILRIGTTSSAEFVLQNGSGGAANCGWGWTDNGWGVLGAPVYFAATGSHTLRIQQREDGAILDQIVLSPVAYVTTPPGPNHDDTTILPERGGPTPDPPPGPSDTDIVLHPSAATAIGGNWVRQSDVTAATGASLLDPDRGVAKVPAAAATPADYFEMTFDAVASTAYRVWIRGKATQDNWANDSVYLQFSGAVTNTGIAAYRIGTTAALWFSLEDCAGGGVSGWGWQDAGGYGSGVSGPLVYFATSGPQTIRIQTREDGLAIDQVVLSPATYLSAAPGAAKGDTTILR